MPCCLRCAACAPSCPAAVRRLRQPGLAAMWAVLWRYGTGLLLPLLKDGAEVGAVLLCPLLRPQPAGPVCHY